MSATQPRPPKVAAIPQERRELQAATSVPIVRFHTSTSPFTVERDLRVKIATKRKSPHPDPLPKGEGDSGSPGDELEVTVTTTDPQGKPVAAELSLAMVEQSLLERFASPLPTIGDFFRGAQREPAVRCTSSITFSLSARHPADQPAIAGGEGSRGDRPRGSGKPQGGDCGGNARRQRADGTVRSAMPAYDWTQAGRADVRHGGQQRCRTGLEISPSMNRTLSNDTALKRTR